MRVQVPGFVRLAAGWPLMEAHRVTKSRLEQIVVTNGDATKNVAKKIAFARSKLVERGDVALAQDERLKRPDRPERNDYGEGIVLANDALVALQLQLQVIAKQAGMFFRAIGVERFIFAS